ncbi:MAG: efflux transporter outer membrane subunit [Thermoanaerobaculales bacterium]
MRAVGCRGRRIVGKIWAVGLAPAMVALLAAGCTLGPEPERPATAADEAAAFAHAADRDPAAAPEVSPWWRSFGDQTTTDLVELALDNNTDLQAAAARVLEVEASFRRAGGARLPQVGYGAGAQRQKMSFVLPGVGRRKIFSTTYSYDFNVSWQADLFGRLKRTQQGMWASLLSEEAAQEAVVHTVVALVVRSRVQISVLERAVAITREITTSWESTLKTVERRYRTGLADAVGLHLARENLASAQAAGVLIEGQLEQARLALDVLVGRRPGSGEDLPATLAELPLLEPVPLGLPAELLDRRPDLRQAEMRLAAATFGVGAALANLYPDLSLTGVIGVRSDTLSDITSIDTLVYNAVANLVGPLFTGGQRRADVAAARARTDQAVATYAGAVLVALREVEDALVLEKMSGRNLDFTRERVSEARAADRLAKQRYQRGVDSLLKVLEAERRLRLAEQAWITATADVWNARIDLFLALGGDWGTALPDGEPTATETAAVKRSRPGSDNPKSGIRLRLSDSSATSPKPPSFNRRAQTRAKRCNSPGCLPAPTIPNSEFRIPNSTEVS